ncbi:uncharacterized protein LOC116222160 isoform X3 [Clupea harengus]|uniref:Uncharacterized protein LOC116222160 isoform X3 n=1 Tax=Clupea harengus TaxID=7950 RepID=A0A6P8FWW0_CLUHA|nr:uncharacterized protein LOC116222160 isoform X3 [Clupea harengus]XP_031431185.1 uncharacterized protein LOC116222160 isoform X3 [Clupea harengus]XP_031431187.1 uncharacterized protein LOC116222160 isoform X3 [Clupea harengus]
MPEKMLKAGLILSFLLLGKVSCYSEGARLGPFCENMDIDHTWSGAPEEDPRPFQIKIVHNEKEFFDYVHLNGGDEVEVALVSEIDIRGFMMDGRDEAGNPAGCFVGLESPDLHILLDCKGRQHTTMTQRDNRAQRRMAGRWTTLSPGLFTFNAAVVANTNYWKRKTIVLPSTTPATTTTSMTEKPTTQPTTSSTTPTKATTTTSMTEKPTTQPTTQPTTSSTTPTKATTTTSMTEKPTTQPTTQPTTSSTTPVVGGDLGGGNENGGGAQHTTTVHPWISSPGPTPHPGCQQVADVALLISHFLNLWGALFLLACNFDLITLLAHRLYSLLSLCAASVALVFSLLCADEGYHDVGPQDSGRLSDSSHSCSHIYGPLCSV